MLWLTTALFGASALIAPIWALTEAEAGVIDWHKQHIGVPLTHWSRTAPTFHRVQEESITLTATGSNVLAALHPHDGSLGETSS
jgi:ER membrane protein complex subunit 1